MRSILMAGLVALLAGGPSLALADPAAPPPPPPPGAAPPAAATAGPSPAMPSINITTLKAIFAAANIAVTEGAYPDNWPYLLANLEGYGIRTSVIDCADTNPQGSCTAIAVESTLTVDVVTLEWLNEYNLYNVFSRATQQAADGGKGTLRASIMVSPGVGPGYVENSYKRFTVEMAYFFDMMAKKNPAAKKGGFAVEKGAVLKADAFSAAAKGHGKAPGAP